MHPIEPVQRSALRRPLPVRVAQGALLLANHPHYFDSMLIMGASPRLVRWLSMTEVSLGPWRRFFHPVCTLHLGCRQCRRYRYQGADHCLCGHHWLVHRLSSPL